MRTGPADVLGTEHFKVTEERLGLGAREEFFTQRVVRCWNSLSREAVATLGSLEVSKAKLDGAWSSPR